MKIDTRTVITVGIGAAVIYFLYKAKKGLEAVGEQAGKVAYDAESWWLQFKEPTPQLTQAAQLSRNDYIKRGYMVKTYKPFPGCVGDTCYTYTITPAGQAYIDAQKAAQSR